MMKFKLFLNLFKVITISRDPTASLVIRQINQKFDSYVFKLDWGVRCFDYKDDPGAFY